jgi:PAS domain S-box-containing protein
MSLQSLADYRYLDVNDAYLEMIGYAREEVVGASSVELKIWADKNVRGEVFDQLRAGKSVRNVETKIKRKDDKERITLLSAEQIALGNESFALISESDISGRLHLESQLRQAQKMEAIGHLAAGVAHDFRNILTVIQGHANLRLLTPNLDPKLAESLTQITEAVERASNLTRQLLAFSRKQIMQMEVVSMNKVVENLTSMLARLIGEQVTLKCRFFEDLPWIEADVCSMEQVILNLAVNARDAMPGGGQLVIATTYIEIDDDYAKSQPEASAGQYVCLTVRDTGCGMEESTKERLFEPFFTTKEVGKGTGMGLATAYGIVKQHNGWIEVESKVGAGSTFTVFLPTTVKRGFKQEKKAAPPRRWEGMKRFSSWKMRNRFDGSSSDLLREYGYKVRLAAMVWKRSKCGKNRATRLICSSRMSSCATDFGPGAGRSPLHDKSELKVIYTSGYSIELLDGHFGSRPDVNFLPKPYHPLKLAETVRTCLDS